MRGSAPFSVFSSRQTHGMLQMAEMLQKFVLCSTCRQAQVPTREQLLAGITYYRARDYLEQVRSHYVHLVRHAKM